MKRKITREIFVEIEIMRVTKKRSAQKRQSAPTKPNISVEICNDGANSFSRNGDHLEELVNKLF